MVRWELRRFATSVRLWVLIALASGYGAAASWVEVPAVALGAGVEKSARLYFAVSLQTLWLLVIGISLVAGGSLADDRRSGYLLVQLGRGVSASQAVFSRLCAAAATALLSVLTAATALALHAAIVGSNGPGGVRSAVSFAPGLLEGSPLGYLALTTAIYGVAAAAMLGCSILIGALTPARFLSEIGPPLGVLLLGFAMTGPLLALNPLERVSFMQLTGVAWATPASMALYWGGILTAAACCALLIFRRRRG